MDCSTPGFPLRISEHSFLRKTSVYVRLVYLRLIMHFLDQHLSYIIILTGILTLNSPPGS